MNEISTEDRETVERVRRELLAAVAMHAMLSNGGVHFKDSARAAYEVADAMIEASGGPLL